MIDRLFEMLSRLNRLQQGLRFKIVATALGLIAVTVVAILAARTNLAWMPETLSSNLVSSAVIGALAVVGVIWLGRTLSAAGIAVVALPFWFVFRMLDMELWAQIALGIGSLSILFLVLIQVARLLLSAPIGPLAVARFVLDEAVRMKLALVFIVLLIIYIPFLATQLDTHERLQYRVQTFLSYGTGVSYALLAVMTVFLSTATVAFEQRDKQIFQIASKPLSRFKYLMGKWIGLAVLNGLLLLMTGGAIFWFTQYLRTQPGMDAYDEMAVTEQVLTSRIGVRPTVPDFREEAKARAAQRAAEDPELKDNPTAIANLANEMLSELQSQMLSIPPGEYREYLFENVTPISRSFKTTVHFDGEPIVVPSRIQSPFDLMVRSEDGETFYVPQTPSQPGQFQLGFAEDATLIRFIPPDSQQTFPNPLREGQTVRIEYYPENALTLRYKLNSGQDMPDVSVPITIWLEGNVIMPQEAVLVQTQNVMIPAGFVNDDHTLSVRIANGNMNTGQVYGETITIPWDGLEIMYKVDTFEANYFRAMLIVWLKLGFLAMLGIAAATFASFPVACLLAFTIFFGAESAPFLAASLENFDKVDPVTKERYYFNTIIWEIASAMQWLLRQYGSVRPTQNLIEGRNVSWAVVSQTFIWISVLWTGLTAFIGWVIFRARQLAIYSGHA